MTEKESPWASIAQRINQPLTANPKKGAALAPFFFFYPILYVRHIQVICLGRILCRHGVYLIDEGLDAQVLTPLADDKACLLHIHVALAQPYGTRLRCMASPTSRLPVP